MADSTPTAAPKVVNRKTGPSLTVDNALLTGMAAKTTIEFGEKVAKYKPTRSLLRRALRRGNEQGHNVAILEAYMIENGIVGSAGRGRTSPVLNEKRTYLVQSLKKHPGQLFLRLPLATLGVVKGDKVSVSFREGRTVVRKKAAAGAPDELEEGEVAGEIVEQPAAEQAQAQAA